MKRLIDWFIDKLIRSSAKNYVSDWNHCELDQPRKWVIEMRKRIDDNTRVTASRPRNDGALSALLIAAPPSGSLIGEAWTIGHESNLRDAYFYGATRAQLCSITGRQIGGVLARLCQLGLVERAPNNSGYIDCKTKLQVLQ